MKTLLVAATIAKCFLMLATCYLFPRACCLLKAAFYPCEEDLKAGRKREQQLRNRPRADLNRDRWIQSPEC